MNNDNVWVSTDYEFSGMMLAPDWEYVEDKHKGYTITLVGEPELFWFQDEPWFWFRFTGKAP